MQSSLFSEENQHVLELAGSIPLNNANAQTLEIVEEKLRDVAKALKEKFDLRGKKGLQRRT